MSTNMNKAIQNTFIQLYIAKGMNGITVRELCQKVPIARTTFYSYYDNLDVVLEEIEDEMIAGLIRTVSIDKEKNIQEMSYFDFHDKLMDYIREQKIIVEALLVIRPNIRFMNKWKDVIKMHIAMHVPYRPGIPNYHLITEAAASAVLSAYVYWIENSAEYNEDELKKLLNKVLHSIHSIL